MAFVIDQRAAGVAGVDGGVGLDEVFDLLDAQPAAAGGADDALRHRLADAEGIADGEHDVADLNLVESASVRTGNCEPSIFNTAMSVFGSVPIDARLELALVVQGDHDLVAPSTT